LFLGQGKSANAGKLGACEVRQQAGGVIGAITRPLQGAGHPQVN
jgi:hypothetical protein